MQELWLTHPQYFDSPQPPENIHQIISLRYRNKMLQQLISLQNDKFTSTNYIELRTGTKIVEFGRYTINVLTIWLFVGQAAKHSN